MDEKIKSIINDDYKNTTLIWKNYFFIGTVLIIAFNVLMFAFASGWRWRVFETNQGNWGSPLHFNHIIISFFSSFDHVNWQHALLNMLCFFVCGLYLERKMGSLKLVLLILSLAFFTSIATTANNNSPHWTGFSAVNFGLYFYIIIDFIFSFFKKSSKINFIFGTVVIGLIYFAMCFSGGTHSFSFRWYPYDLINNMGHYSGALAGLILALTIKIAKLGYIKKKKNQEENEQANKKGKWI